MGRGFPSPKRQRGGPKVLSNSEMFWVDGRSLRSGICEHRAKPETEMMNRRASVNRVDRRGRSASPTARR
jgi:hypothetical protein